MDRAFSEISKGPARNVAALCVLFGALIYLYSILFTPLGTPRDVGGDNALFLNEAGRILHGQLIYRDFFQFNLAGTQFLYAAVIRLFGARTWIPNVCLVLLGLGFLWMSIVVSRRLVTGSAVFLPGLLFLCVAFRNYLDATHHWYSALLIVAALSVLSRKRSSARLEVAGALCGLAACFSQNHGPLAAIGCTAFVWWEGYVDGSRLAQIIRRELHFVAPFVTVFGACLAYFATTVGVIRFLSLTLVFPFRYWGTTEWSSWWAYEGVALVHQIVSHQLHIWRRLFIVILVPGIYLATLFSYLRRRSSLPSHEERLAILVSSVGLSQFVSIVNSATLERLSVVSLPGFILLVWLCDAGRSARKAALIVLWIAVVSVMSRGAWMACREPVVYVRTPRGQIALGPDAESYYRWMARNTRPDDKIFATDDPQVYFRFGLENPTKLPFITNCDFTRPEQVSELVTDLDKHGVRIIVWEDDSERHPCPLSSDHLGPLREYLRACYREVATFPGVGVRAYERFGCW